MVDGAGGVHGDRDGGNPAGMDLTIAGFPRGWILLRRESRIEPFTSYNDLITNALTRINTYESVMNACNFCLVS